MRLGPPTTVARLNLDETVTGLWAFANALGLLTDDIAERTGGAGVTVDGLLIRDAGIPEAAVTAHEAALAILEAQIVDGTLLARLGATETITGSWTFAQRIFGQSDLVFEDIGAAGNLVLRYDVVGDTNRRFTQSADGRMQWGSGAGPLDVDLARTAANRLATNDDFGVGGKLDLAGPIELSKQDTVIVARTDDFDIGGKTIQQFLPTGNQDITGFAGGVDGRVVAVRNGASAATVTLKHQDANSVAANRFDLDLDSDFVIVDGAAKMLAYNGTSSRWAPIA